PRSHARFHRGGPWRLGRNVHATRLLAAPPLRPCSTEKVANNAGLLPALLHAHPLFCILNMATSLKRLGFATAALLSSFSLAEAQTASPSPATSPAAALPTNPVSASAPKAGDAPLLLVQSAPAAASPAPAAAKTTP